MTTITHPELLDLPRALRTARLIVRAYRDGDGASLFAAIQRSRAHLSQWMGWVDNFKTIDDQEAYVRRMQGQWLMRQDLVFGVFLPDDSTVIGAMGLHDPNWQVPSLMMGWWVSADHSQQGYTTEGASAVLKFGFEHCKARRIWASCDANNAASERVMQKIGLLKEAHLLDDRLDMKGEPASSVLYAKVGA